MSRILIKPFRLDASGVPVEWHITAVTEHGGAASKSTRAKARRKAKTVFGTSFFYKNPPSQFEIDAKLNHSAVIQ